MITFLFPPTTSFSSYTWLIVGVKLRGRIHLVASDHSPTVDVLDQVDKQVGNWTNLNSLFWHQRKRYKEQNIRWAKEEGKKGDPTVEWVRPLLDNAIF